jgi:ABC-2 type transport system permease protein
MNTLIKQSRMELIRTLRSKAFFIFSIIMPVVFYFIFSSTIGDQTQVGGSDWKAYYLMSMTLFGIISSSLFTLGLRIAQERKEGWTQLMKITPLPASTYFIAKIVGQSLINLGIIMLMFIIGRFAKGVELSLMTWVSCGLWMLIGTLPFIALGTLIGQSKSTESATVFANIANLGLALLGGLWMPMEILPKFIRTVGEWLPTYRLGQGAWNLVAGKGLSLTGIAILAAYLVIFMILSSYIMRRREAV